MIFITKYFYSKLTIFIVFIIFAVGFVYFNTKSIISESNSCPKHLIVIGGASDVYTLGCYNVINATLTDSFLYFNWFQETEIENYINSIKDDKKIILIGYSWGCKTLMSIYGKNTDRVDLMITLDPVSFFKKSTPCSTRWINVVPVYQDLSLDNFIATIGNRWKECDLADNITIESNHRDVDIMLLAKIKTGENLWDIILDELDFVSSKLKE